MITPLEVAQYEQLKAEQRDRMKIRDRLPYVTFVALGGAIALSVSGSGIVRSSVFLAVPLICLILGWTFLRNNDKIAEIGRFIRETYPECRWESYRFGINGRRRKKIIQLIVNLIQFVVIGYIALGVFWSSLNIGIMSGLASGVEVILLAILAVEFIRISDVFFIA
jgi:hypothetical protein